MRFSQAHVTEEHDISILFEELQPEEVLHGHAVDLLPLPGSSGEFSLGIRSAVGADLEKGPEKAGVLLAVPPTQRAGRRGRTSREAGWEPLLAPPCGKTALRVPRSRFQPINYPQKIPEEPFLGLADSFFGYASRQPEVDDDENSYTYHALQRTQPGRRGCNRRIPSVLRRSTATEDGCAGSLSVGR